MESKIRIRMGEVEVEYEGKEAFLKKELPDLLSAISTLYAASTQSRGGAQQQLEDNPDVDMQGGGALTGTTNTIAKKLGVNSGKSLFLAAAAQLTFVQKKTKFTRKEIQDECREANEYYKSSYANNYTNYVSKLTSSEDLSEISKGVYSIPAKAKAELEKKLV